MALLHTQHLNQIIPKYTYLYPMQKILITGSNGQLGRSFQALVNDYPKMSFVLADRKLLDITDESAVLELFGQYSFDYCINTAAYTAVDRAEEEVDAALLANAEAVAYLAKACKKHNTKLIHFSTDYVYADHNRPLLETDKTQPESIYARTKLKGEDLLFSILPDACVFRTSWVYADFGHNFVRTMLRLGIERDQLSVVYDQVGSPTYAPDLAKAILAILSQKKLADQLSGIYNYSNEGVLSWYDFAKAIFELSHIECKISPITSDQYPTAAKRPAYSVLNKQKFKDTFGLEIPYWKDSLAQMLKNR